MTRRAELEVTLGSQAGRRRSGEAKPFRALVLGAFSGVDAAPSDGLLPRRISADNFDAVMTRIGPTVALRSSTGLGEETLRLARLEDFHPDRLVESSDLLRGLSTSNTPARSEPLANKTSPPADEGQSQLLERVLGQRATSSEDRAQQKVRALIESALSHAAAPSPLEGGRERDESRTALLRTILADDEFRSLERAWRSVHWLVSRLDEDQLELYVADLSKSALAQQMASFGNRLDTAPVHALLTSPAGDAAWDAIVTDYSFTLEQSDLLMLATLGALAARVPCPVLAAADLRLCGCRSNSAVEAPWDWSLGDDDVAQLCREVRRHPAARQVMLATPRFLLRHPYGKRTEPIESFAFEELTPRPKREDFVWASAAFACAHWLAAQHTNASDALAPLEDLPAPPYDDGGGDAVQPPLELLLSERARAVAEQHGVITLIGGRNTNRIATAGLFPWADADPSAAQEKL